MPADTHRSKARRIHPVLSDLPPDRTRKNKVVSAEEAVQIIRDGDTIATGGFVGTGFPEYVDIVLEEYFLETGRPRGLTLMYAAGQGDHSRLGGDFQNFPDGAA